MRYNIAKTADAGLQHAPWHVGKRKSADYPHWLNKSRPIAVLTRRKYQQTRLIQFGAGWISRQLSVIAGLNARQEEGLQQSNSSESWCGDQPVWGRSHRKPSAFLVTPIECKICKIPSSSVTEREQVKCSAVWSFSEIKRESWSCCWKSTAKIVTIWLCSENVNTTDECPSHRHRLRQLHPSPAWSTRPPLQ